MYVGIMLADDVVTRGAYGVGGGALVILAIPLLASGVKKSNRPVKRTASGGLGIILAFVALAMVGKSTGGSSPSTPTVPPSHRTVVTTPGHKPATHKPAAPKPAPHHNGGTGCANQLFCIHN